VPSLIDQSLLRLTIGRACAWALLVSGWIGIAALALQFTPNFASAFALVALWLLVLGGAASVGTGGNMRRGVRSLAIIGCAVLAVVGLVWSVRGGGLLSVVLILFSWGALTALASGVVRSLRLFRQALPEPPVIAATLGALSAGLILGDLGDLSTLSTHLAIFVSILAGILVLLQFHLEERASAPGCRAGLFDCSLPAWPVGAWRDLEQWPLLLAGLAMLPMMASLPVMVALCRVESIPPQVLVLAHLVAMFGSAVLLRRWIAHWTTSMFAKLCLALLVSGAALAIWLLSPWDMLGLALTHGAAWGLAWSGQLWAPDRRGRQNASPFRAAIGYALLTIIFGVFIEGYGAKGITFVHTLIGVLALVAWIVKDLSNIDRLIKKFKT
jgi:hypothetical protein